MNMRDLCFHLKVRRRMYLLDDRFTTAVAFVEGYNAAFNQVPLAGFRDYVAARILNAGSVLHWSYIIASSKVPEILSGNLGLDQLPAELDIELTDMLVDLMESYQESEADS